MYRSGDALTLAISIPEGIVEVPAGLSSLSPEAEVTVQLVSDNGDDIYYGDGVIAKELPNDRLKKFRSDKTLVGLAPTAAGVAISGRLVNAFGDGVGAAEIELRSSDGTVRKAVRGRSVTLCLTMSRSGRPM